MELKLNGKVKLILDLQSWDSGFTKREFVITTNEQYPQDVKLECIKDKTSLLDGLSDGDDVEVSFNVRGNEYNGKYYVNLQAWKLNKMDGGPADSENTPPAPDFEPAGDQDDDDLPF
jgi:single-strand DNA-binding protein